MEEVKGDLMADVVGTSSADQEEVEAELSSYEEMFAHRFTAADAEHVKTLEKPNPPPPVVTNWYSRPKRTYDWARGRGQSGYRGRGNYGHHADRDSRPWQNDYRRRDDRYRQDGYRRDDSYRREHGDHNSDRTWTSGGHGRVYYAGLKGEERDERQPKYSRPDRHEPLPQ